MSSAESVQAVFVSTTTLVSSFDTTNGGYRCTQRAVLALDTLVAPGNSAQVRHMEELNLELMRVDQAEKARKARRDMMRRLKVSPGVWTRFEVRKARGPLYINGGIYHSTVYLALSR